jgi:ABC transporter with metal-binding/Fe-S-binding domain ATP-binding protein
MKIACLFSGGKDSMYAAYLMSQAGHDIISLLTVVSGNPDSLMFHTPNINMAGVIADCLGIAQISEYSETADELAPISVLLRKAADMGAEGVVTGAILSDYQFTKIDRLCWENGLKCFSPLWRKSQLMLLSDIVESGIEAIVTKVAAEGMGEDMLGRRIDGDFISRMKTLQRKFGVNPCGEGGEYETMTLDSPMHVKRLVIKKSRIIKSASSPGFLVEEAEAVNKA